MSPRLMFDKVTREGLSLVVEEFDKQPLLLLLDGRKRARSGITGRAVQVLGIVAAEMSTPDHAWYYEYELLPPTFPLRRFAAYMDQMGYQLGVFDQYGNFQPKAA